MITAREIIIKNRAYQKEEDRLRAEFQELVFMPLVMKSMELLKSVKVTA